MIESREEDEVLMLGAEEGVEEKVEGNEEMVETEERVVEEEAVVVVEVKPVVALIAKQRPPVPPRNFIVNRGGMGTGTEEKIAAGEGEPLVVGANGSNEEENDPCHVQFQESNSNQKARPPVPTKPPRKPNPLGASGAGLSLRKTGDISEELRDLSLEDSTPNNTPTSQTSVVPESRKNIPKSNFRVQLQNKLSLSHDRVCLSKPTVQPLAMQLSTTSSQSPSRPSSASSLLSPHFVVSPPDTPPESYRSNSSPHIASSISPRETHANTIHSPSSKHKNLDEKELARTRLMTLFEEEDKKERLQKKLKKKRKKKKVAFCFEAVRKNDVRLLEIALSTGLSVNCCDKKTLRTPLHLAAANGFLAVVELILGKGGRVNLKDERGWIPLHDACNAAHLDIVKLLLGHGSDPTVTTESGALPLHYLVGSFMDVSHENTMLDLVEEMHRLGANVNQRTVSEETLLHFACQSRHAPLSVIRFLLDVGCAINLGNKRGLTPLHYAVLMRDRKRVELLIERGADVNFATGSGQSPKQLAEEDSELYSIFYPQMSKPPLKTSNSTPRFKMSILRPNLTRTPTETLVTTPQKT